MKTNARGTRIAVGALALLAQSGSLTAGSGFAQPGSYRPVEGQTSSGNAQGQFVPAQDRANAQRWPRSQPLPSPVLPQQPRTPAPHYLPGAPAVPAYPQPGYSQPAYPQANHGPAVPPYDTGNPYLPPPVPPITPVAPVYNPPVPAAPLRPPLPAGYGYGYPGQPQAPATYSAQPQAPASHPGQQHWPQPSGSMPAPHPQAPSASRQAATPTTPGKAAPRPFSNPQESGSSFTPRAITIQPGRHDSRFRPPELKGTP